MTEAASRRRTGRQLDVWFSEWDGSLTVRVNCELIVDDMSDSSVRASIYMLHMRHLDSYMLYFMLNLCVPHASVLVCKNRNKYFCELLNALLVRNAFLKSFYTFILFTDIWSIVILLLFLVLKEQSAHISIFMNSNKKV